MPRKKEEIPGYKVHLGSGLGYLVLNGSRVYVGKHGPEARQKYARVLAEWLAAGRRRPVAESDVMIVELCSRFLAWAATYYKSGESTSTEFAKYTYVVKALHALYETIAVSDFGPLQLKTLRHKWVTDGLCRRTCNDYVGRVKRIIKWGVAEGMVGEGVLAKLAALIPTTRRSGTLANEHSPSLMD